MSTTPSRADAGATAVICVSLSTVKLGDAVPPTSTAVAPVKQSPVMMTVLPPATGPASGSTPVISATSQSSTSRGAEATAGLVPLPWATTGAGTGGEAGYLVRPGRT